MRRVQGEGFWYMASPYSKFPGGLEAAEAAACEAAGWLINQGVHVFAPIPHSHGIAVRGAVDPSSHTVWLEQDQAIARSAVGLIIVELPTWECSFGVNEERKWFASWHKPEMFVKWPLEEEGA